MELIVKIVVVMVYSLISGGVIFGLLVAADKHAWPVDMPWVYILCGIAWPVAALPAAGYIAAGWALNKRYRREKHG